jgi:hypothetical protein
MVGNCHPLLASAKDAAGRTQKNMTPRTSHKGEKQNHALEKCIAAANRGWMSEKYLPPAGQEKCFFLTSPFIEPAHHPFLSEETRLLVEVRGSHPSTKNAEGWGTQLCGRVKFEKLRVRHPPITFWIWNNGDVP